jgi:hypothetical protein
LARNTVLLGDAAEDREPEVDHRGVTALGVALSQNKKLVSLDLSENQLGQAAGATGLRALLKGLQRNHSVQVLVLIIRSKATADLLSYV